MIPLNRTDIILTGIIYFVLLNAPCMLVLLVANPVVNSRVVFHSLPLETPAVHIKISAPGILRLCNPELLFVKTSWPAVRGQLIPRVPINIYVDW